MEIPSNHKQCTHALRDIKDAMEALGGKWKLQILIAILSGNRRFREIERSIPKMTSKVLAKELKDLEEHKLIRRMVYDGPPVLVEYTPTEYADSLQDVLQVLRAWGAQHRNVIMGKAHLSEALEGVDIAAEMA